MRRLGRERGESILELVLWVGGAVAALGVAGYAVLWARAQGATKLTPEQAAYVQVVATQQADAYIRAVATLQARQPAPAPAPANTPVPRASSQQPAPSQPRQPSAPPPAPAPTNTPVPYIPPPPPPPAPAPTPTAPPPPPSSKPPMATCVGYMARITSTGIEACNQITQDTSWDTKIRNCIYDVITGQATSAVGKGDCLGAALATSDAYLSDCFLGLSDQSHFGMTSCRQYYGRN